MIIFDLDGTLVDTLCDLHKAVNFSLSLLEFPTRSLEQVRKDIGNGTIKLIERSCPTGTNKKLLKKAHKSFKDFYKENITLSTKPYQNVTSVLLELKTRGYKLAIVSNKDHFLTKKIINSLFPEVFDYIQGSYKTHPKKPDPYLINRIVSTSKINIENITYIGDTEVDKQSALNSNLNYFIVSYGYRTKKELSAHIDSSKIIDTVKEILEKFN